ncbi:hypothetical protein BDK51DRAFT_41929 [Blyttiomyces helicus]|uniref:Uncharacterized protein n=1 Tax=Blyttiomyces helicus TaxID=388810 RepID=A0A4V1IR49_9FUNG|nr:hypothetical protein BDK51DRAFT_41929 [Blyttiomyces helicus]|eukprot:RKO88817.1 hypothetical protein BDK51DRAFT_41929 [Blyttiomyces helicus]
MAVLRHRPPPHRLLSPRDLSILAFARSPLLYGAGKDITPRPPPLHHTPKCLVLMECPSEVSAETRYRRGGQGTEMGETPSDVSPRIRIQESTSGGGRANLVRSGRITSQPPTSDQDDDSRANPTSPIIPPLRQLPRECSLNSAHMGRRLQEPSTFEAARHGLRRGAAARSHQPPTSTVFDSFIPAVPARDFNDVIRGPLLSGGCRMDNDRFLWVDGRRRRNILVTVADRRFGSAGPGLLAPSRLCNGLPIGAANGGPGLNAKRGRRIIDGRRQVVSVFQRVKHVSPVPDSPFPADADGGTAGARQWEQQFNLRPRGGARS